MTLNVHIRSVEKAENRKKTNKVGLIVIQTLRKIVCSRHVNKDKNNTNICHYYFWNKLTLSICYLCFDLSDL